MMNSAEEEKGYSYNNEEDEVDNHNQKEIIRETGKLSWLLGPFDSQEVYNKTKEAEAEAAAAAAAINFDNKGELMDLSLGNGNSATGESSGTTIEKEHMFDKVVTPSDVGKLNRLVIPKQHAERYFPLDTSSNEKGLLLNFEDRNGKAWRFRYSYWNSSQSYVMTKGWSRFVKDKKLDAGDTVSFHRGIGELGKDRLYIDWRRRVADIISPDPTSLAQMQLQNQLRFHPSVRWGTGTRFYYSLPQSLSFPTNLMGHTHSEHLQHMNYNTIHPNYYQHNLHHHHQQQHPVQCYLRPSSGSVENEGGHMPMVIDSVPVVPGKITAAKRLRLFGVNMECPTQDDDQSPATTSAAPISATRQATEYSNKGKSSLSFKLDL